MRKSQGALQASSLRPACPPPSPSAFHGGMGVSLPAPAWQRKLGSVLAWFSVLVENFWAWRLQAACYFPGAGLPPLARGDPAPQ